MHTSVCAVIVAYNPKPALLHRVVTAVCRQTDHLYLVDNGSTIPVRHSIGELPADVEIVEPGCNEGVAAGCNQGIRRAKAAGYRYVLLLDQDSIIADTLVATLLAALQGQIAHGLPVAAVGSRYKDPDTGHTSRFVRFTWFGNRYCGDERTPIVPADILISSGTLFPLAVFDDIGFFNEALFIDHVDTEWFLRARFQGYRAYGVWAAIMEHSLGERGIRVWLGRWRVLPLHLPFRLYYIVRNSLLLYRMPHTPNIWISGDILRLIRLCCCYLLFSSSRKEAAQFMARGVLDAVRGVAGPCTAK